MVVAEQPPSAGQHVLAQLAGRLPVAQFGQGECEAILALPPEERPRQLDTEAAFFAEARPAAQTSA